MEGLLEKCGTFPQPSHRTLEIADADARDSHSRLENADADARVSHSSHRSDDDDLDGVESKIRQIQTGGSDACLSSYRKQPAPTPEGRKVNHVSRAPGHDTPGAGAAK